MFERFIRLAKARKALQEGRFEAAIALAQDPVIAADRRAEKVSAAARERLLERAQHRLQASDLSAALLDVERVLASGDSAPAQELKQRLQLELQQRQAAEQQARQAVDKARRLAERGQLAAAQEHLTAATESAPQARAVGQFVAARRQRASEQEQAARQRFAAGDLDGALADYQGLQALDAELAQASQLGAQLRRELGRMLAADLEAAIAADRLESALQRLARAEASLPGVTAVEGVQPPRERLLALLRARLTDPADLAACTPLARAIVNVPAGLLGTGGDAVHAAATALLRAAELRQQGRFDELGEALQACAAGLGSRALLQEAEAARGQARDIDDRLRRARAAAAEGDFTAARAELASILETWPMHPGARKEVELIDAGNLDREQRLGCAREAARAGRLCEASSLLLALAVPGAAGEDARLLLKDVRARMDLVGRGLDQVRSNLHGREAATAEGVRHCQMRLQELTKVQVDHPELEAAVAALQCELDGLAAIDAANAALQTAELAKACEAIEPLHGMRDRLLSRDRLDARVQGLGDRFLVAAETALSSGRLGDVDRCGAALGNLWGLDAAAMARFTAVQQRASEQRARAEELVGVARGLLAARDAEAAGRCLLDIRQLCLDLPSARRLEAELQGLQHHLGGLQRVEVLAGERDFDGAHRRLEDLPPTPPMLRTRIFDMKQSLAKAQGLEGAFVLRVDEGGEFVVLRGESVSIGNVRDGSADLAILANVAGRHASIRRSMSFHGGMQDSIVAEGGEVRVGGAVVAQHVLKPGDRVQLGPTLQFDYRLPSNRSLTAALALRGGFQVAGTDRVLLFKDRGRDGRILMSSGKDGHVQVSGATGEVEIFANKTGQVRVRCEGGGSIDGRPFKGEHPVDAGAMVQAAGISFVLLPLQRQR